MALLPSQSLLTPSVKAHSTSHSTPLLRSPQRNSYRLSTSSSSTSTSSSSTSSSSSSSVRQAKDPMKDYRSMDELREALQARHLVMRSPCHVSVGDLLHHFHLPYYVVWQLVLHVCVVHSSTCVCGTVPYACLYCRWTFSICMHVWQVCSFNGGQQNCATLPQAESRDSGPGWLTGILEVLGRGTAGDIERAWGRKRGSVKKQKVMP